MKDHLLGAFFTVLAIAVFATVIVSLIRVVDKAAVRRRESLKQDYSECKQKASDIEWCVKQIYGTDIQ